jgi:AraC-like DNA-binding protein
MEKNFRRHLLLNQYPRIYHGTPRLYAVGWVAQKTEWFETAFETTNFSFIFRGRGKSNYRGVEHAVQPPSVILEVEGEHCDYGPLEAWEEVYFVYKGQTEEVLKRWRLSRTLSHHLWPMAGLARIQEYLATFEELARMPGMPGAVDRMDRLAELIILESLLGEPIQNLTPDEVRIHEAERHIRENFVKPLDLKALAADHGFSLPTFRRHWNRQFKSTPMRLLNTLRLEKAYQLLLGTKEDVSAIAYAVGYADPLYFSKKFRAQYRIPPSRLRNQA